MRAALKYASTRPVHGLASRIILVVFSATLLTSLVVTWVSTQSLRTFLREKIDQKFPAILAGVAERLDIWYGQRKLDIETFAGSAILTRNLDRGARGGLRSELAQREMREYLSYVLEGFPQYEALFVLDADGVERFWVGEGVELPESLRQELGQSSVASLSNAYVHGGRLVQVASAPLRDASERHLGSLHALLRAQAIEGLLKTERLGPSGRISLVGNDGSLLVRSDGPGSGRLHNRPLPQPGDSPRVTDYTNSAGLRVIGSSLRLRQFGWTLVVEEPYDEAFLPAVATMRYILAINLATVLVFGLIALRIALSIVQPIQALSRAARRIADGEIVKIPEGSRQDELGLLTRTFNHMSDRLQRNRLELQESRLNVEAANARLRGLNEELQRDKEALEQLSITDGLTKLYNHRFFQENLTREIARVKRSGGELQLILIDIDNFKQLNDRLGHAAGDTVLCEVAAVMSELVRESDVLARYGGEEFALVPSHTDLDGAVGLAEKIRMAVSELDIAVDGETIVRITVSIGVASYRGDRKTFFNDADRALYRAKGSGKDCVVVETGTDPGAKRSRR